MKAFILMSTLVTAAAATWLLQPGATPVAPTPAGYAPMPERFDPAVAEHGAKAAAALAAVPAEEPVPAGLTRPELEARIAEIDARIESGKLIERGNLGQLDENGRRDLRNLLERRNRLMVRKIDLDLGEG